jgi:Aminoglycoside N3''-acetyltransferase
MSLGIGSDFSILKDQDFSLLLLGTNYQNGCTYLHHMEAVWGVPYRTYVNSKKLVIDETTNGQKILNIKYFARNEKKMKSNFAIVETQKELSKVSKKIATKYGSSTIVSLKDLDEIIGQKIKYNPYFLVV